MKLRGTKLGTVLGIVLIAACLAPLAYNLVVFARQPQPVPGGEDEMQSLLAVPVTHLYVQGNRAVPLTNPNAGDQAAIARGKKLYKSMHCVGCHAPQGGGGIGPALSDAVWIYGHMPGDIYLTIAHGRPGGMPAWGGALPPSAIWDIVSYVQSLGARDPDLP